MMSVATTHKVLLVEDSPTQAKLLRYCVEKMGLRALGPVATATDAIEICSTEWPALAILDVALADGMDGIELAHELRLKGNIPIIFASSIDNALTMNRLQAMQPLAILPKPYSLAGLRRVIELGLYGHMHTPVDWQDVKEKEMIYTPHVPWLFVRERGHLLKVMISDISTVQMEQKYCAITLFSGQHYLMRASLMQMIEHLASQFIQVHRSWLVQLNSIESVDLTAGFIKLTGNKMIPVGRAYRENLVKELGLHLFDKS